jgi:hypothetical protein
LRIKAGEDVLGCGAVRQVDMGGFLLFAHIFLIVTTARGRLAICLRGESLQVVNLHVILLLRYLVGRHDAGGNWSFTHEFRLNVRKKKDQKVRTQVTLSVG